MTAASVLLSDGTVGRYARRHDDCLPSCVATCLCVPLTQVPDLRLDQRLSEGIAPADVDRQARGEIERWLAGRGLRMIEHDRPPIDLPRWVGEIPLPGWFVSHCIVMSYAKVLFDPTPLVPPPEVVLMALRFGLPSLRRREWKAEEVKTGLSFVPR